MAVPARPALLAAKLRTLVGGRWGAETVAAAKAGTFPGGATLQDGDRGWILAEDGAERALGGALAWARSRGVTDLHLLAGPAAGLLARRAAAFAAPPTVWRVDGITLARADPEPLPPPAPLAADVAAFVPVLFRAGAEPVVEDGTLAGEVLGLEVARVVVDDLGARLEVGVGRLDREAQRLVHGDRPPEEALAAAVRAVRELRRGDRPAHPVNQLARERWLRSVVVARPELVGAASLAVRPGLVRRADLRQSAPVSAAGEDLDGRPVVVVCSTGVDIDLVPAAADARLAEGRSTRLVLVVPEGDDHPVTRALAGALVEPAEVLVVAPGWEASLGEADQRYNPV